MCFKSGGISCSVSIRNVSSVEVQFVAVVWTVGVPLSFGFTYITSYLQYSSVKYCSSIHLFISYLAAVCLAGWINQLSVSIGCFSCCR